MANYVFNRPNADRAKSEFKKQASQLEQIQGDLKKNINAVSSWWEGESKQAFLQQYETFAPSLQELAKLATSVATQVESITTIKFENEERRSKLFKR